MSLKRTTVLFLVLIGACSMTNLEFNIDAALPDVCKTSMIIISYDDLGNNDLKYNTPAIDTLMANGGVYLSNFYALPKCTATRACAFTGRYAQNYAFQLWDALSDPETDEIADTALLISENLGTYGYTSGLFGKWHLGNGATANPLNHGFDEFFGYQHGEISFRNYISRTGIAAMRDGTTTVGPNPANDYATDTITDRAIKYMVENINSSFFISISYPAPHVPLQARSDPAIRTEGVSYTGNPCGPYSDATRYELAIEQTDENIARIIDTLKYYGQFDDTFILIFSDNGGGPTECAQLADNSPHRGIKSQVLEGGIHVPAIAYWGDRFSGAGDTLREYIHPIDIYPTIMDVANVPLNKEVEGVSFYRSLLGVDTIPARYIYIALDDANDHRATIDTESNLKWVDESVEALYDIETDPGETTNLQGSNPTEFTTLRNAWITWWNQYQ